VCDCVDVYKKPSLKLSKLIQIFLIPLIFAVFLRDLQYEVMHITGCRGLRWPLAGRGEEGEGQGAGHSDRHRFGHHVLLVSWVFQSP